MESDDVTNVRTRDALRAAHLYYVQELTMEDIATEMRISRSSISRLLAYAREIGLVEITVHPPQDGVDSLTERIIDRFGARIATYGYDAQDLRAVAPMDPVESS